MNRNPGLVFCGVDDLRLLKGVVVRDDQPETIRVLAGKAVRRDGHSVVPVELRGVWPTAARSSTPGARSSWATATPRPPPAASTSPSLPPYASTRREIYRDVLFHGPDLQGIVGRRGVRRRGIAARSRPRPPPSAWVDRPLRRG